MALEKAKIIAEKSQQETIEVLFNPNEYSLDISNNFKFDKIPGLSVPIGRFISGNDRKLKMELFFDTYESGEDVRDYTSKISDLLEIDADLHAPPICTFVWGSLSFRGAIISVNQKFTMFLDSGTPVRARLNVTFQKCESITEQLTETPRQSSDRTKRRTIKQGEQLWMIAVEEYEDPKHWREIARANGIENPRLLETGKHVVVPPLE